MPGGAMQPGSPVVLITGAGSGLGAEMARRFARAGFRVAVTDVDAGRAENVSKELVESGATSLYSVLDVTSDADWERVRQEVLDQWSAVNVLVNNAGVAASGAFEQTSMADWQWVIDIDLMGVVRGSHYLMAVLRSEAEAGRTAHLINIASFAGFSAMPGLSAYGTAKAAVISLSEHLMTELDGTGVGVSVVCPSFVATNLLETFRSTDSDTQKTVERWMKHSPVTAKDVADIVFDAMCQNQFLVLTHPKTQWALRLKKYFPKRYYRRISELGRLARGDKK